MPHSVPVVLLLPPPQFEEALAAIPQMTEHVVTFCSRHKAAVPVALRSIISKLLEEHRQLIIAEEEFQDYPEQEVEQRREEAKEYYDTEIKPESEAITPSEG